MSNGPPLYKLLINSSALNSKSYAFAPLPFSICITPITAFYYKQDVSSSWLELKLLIFFAI